MKQTLTGVTKAEMMEIIRDRGVVARNDEEKRNLQSFLEAPDFATFTVEIDVKFDNFDKFPAPIIRRSSRRL